MPDLWAMDLLGSFQERVRGRRMVIACVRQAVCCAVWRGPFRLRLAVEIDKLHTPSVCHVVPPIEMRSAQNDTLPLSRKE